MSINEFKGLKVGDKVNVVLFIGYKHTMSRLPVTGKSISKVQVKYPDGRLVWKSIKVLHLSKEIQGETENLISTIC